MHFWCVIGALAPASRRWPLAPFSRRRGYALLLMPFELFHDLLPFYRRLTSCLSTTPFRTGEVNHRLFLLPRYRTENYSVSTLKR